MKIETYTGTLIHDVPDVGTVKVDLPEERVKVELAYAEQLTSIGCRVLAIKHLRSVFNTGLKEAHRMTSAAAERRSSAQRVDAQHAKWETAFSIDEDRAFIKCMTCGFEEADEQQARCLACGRKFTKEVPYADA